LISPKDAESTGRTKRGRLQLQKESFKEADAVMRSKATGQFDSGLIAHMATDKRSQARSFACRMN
jgi:hypothetical protein